MGLYLLAGICALFLFAVFLKVTNLVSKTNIKSSLGSIVLLYDASSKPSTKFCCFDLSEVFNYLDKN